VVVVEVVLLYTFPTAPLMRMVTLLSIVTLSDGTVMNAGKCKGEDGVDGKDGADGSNGKSAYEMWIDAGNTGTEDFLNSLKGEKEILVKPELQELMEKMVHKDLKVMMESHQL
jgi:hypothetical protein